MTDSKTRERVVVAVRRCLPGIPHLRHTPLPRWRLMRAHPRPLSAVCATLPDFRTPRGTRHPVTAICALACCALFWGARSDRAIAAWGRHDGTRLAQALGCTHAPPGRPRVTPSVGTWTVPSARPTWVPGPTGSSGVCPPPLRPRSLRWSWRGQRGAVPTNKARRGPPGSRRWRTREA